jgi:hypothetical protein
MQWRKLFDLNPIYAVITDKLAARDFIAERVGAQVLVPLLWIGDDPAAVPFDALEPPYVIKSTHASGHVLLVRTRQDVDPDKAVTTLREWLGRCHGIEKNQRTSRCRDASWSNECFSVPTEASHSSADFMSSTAG